MYCCYPQTTHPPGRTPALAAETPALDMRDGFEPEKRTRNGARKQLFGIYTTTQGLEFSLGQTSLVYPWMKLMCFGRSTSRAILL